MSRPIGDSLNAEKILAQIIRAQRRRSFLMFTLTDAAGILRIKPPSIYNHFRGLGDLKNQISILALDQFEQALAPSLRFTHKRQALSSFMIAYRNFALENPFLFEAAQFGLMSKEKKILAKSHELARMSEKLMDAFSIPSDRRIHALRILRSLLGGFIQIELNKSFQLKEDPDQSFQSLIDFTITGLEGLGGRS